MTHTPDTTARFIDYARKAAEGFLTSWEFYGQRFVPAAAIGGPATPAYYANMLAKAVHMLDDYAGLEAAKAAAIAEYGDEFLIWEFYARGLAERSGQRYVPAPPADRVPVIRVSSCRYCNRYGRACGRHETIRPVWTPEDAAQTARDAAAHRTYAAR